MTSDRRAVSMEVYHEICQHYYAEAHLLQERRYREWLSSMVAEDIHLWMPVFEVRFVKDKRPAPSPNDAAIFNDRFEDLTQRVERLYTGQVWMEDPPSKIRYFINNVEAFDVGGGEYETRCNIFIQRHRRQDEMSQHSMGREDRLRRDGEGFKVATRKLTLDARVIQDKNLYFFV